MSEAIGASITAVSTGPSVGASIGASMGGETSMSGIGFEGGSPSFSGLGRSDTGLRSISVNEGPIGPVSFSNSTDLFSETRPFVGSLANTPEMAIKGDIFGQTDAVARAQDEAPDSARPRLAEIKLTSEAVSLFDNTTPFQVTMPTNEGPAPMPSLDGFTTISSFSEPSFGFESESEQNSQVSIEAVIGSESAELGLAETDIKDAVEDLRTNDPLTYMQLKSDLESVQTILDIVDEVTTAETAASISNVAISTAVERSGLIQALEKVSEEPETKAEADPSTDPMRANVQAIMESVNPHVEEVAKPRQEQPKEEYFVHEEANEARRTETVRAIRTAFEEDIDPETGKVKGKAVVDILPVELPAEEISEIVLKEGGKNDGSEAQRRNHLSLLEFTTEEEALDANDRLIAENNAVTDVEATKRATEAEAAKVKSGIRTQIGEVEVFPLAA